MANKDIIVEDMNSALLEEKAQIMEKYNLSEDDYDDMLVESVEEYEI
jgi:hypothetical protein